MSKEKLQKLFYKASEENIDTFLAIFNEQAKDFGINTEFKTNIFLGQILTEVGVSLEPKEENMNYSVAGLKNTFRYFRQHPGQALREGRSKQHHAMRKAIANHAYSNRMGNGSFESGDGYRYRGKGYIQLTGKNNYNKIASVLGMTPEVLAAKITTVEGGLLSALGYWKVNSIGDARTMDKATAIINKRTKTYQKRRNNYMKAVNA